MLLPHTTARCDEVEEALQIMIEDERNNNATMTTTTKLFSLSLSLFFRLENVDYRSGVMREKTFHISFLFCVYFSLNRCEQGGVVSPIKQSYSHLHVVKQTNTIKAERFNYVGEENNNVADDEAEWSVLNSLRRLMKILTRKSRC